MNQNYPNVAPKSQDDVWNHSAQRFWFPFLSTILDWALCILSLICPCNFQILLIMPYLLEKQSCYSFKKFGKNSNYSLGKNLTMTSYLPLYNGNFGLWLMGFISSPCIIFVCNYCTNTNKQCSQLVNRTAQALTKFP
jgi:hypothetical protein